MPGTKQAIASPATSNWSKVFPSKQDTIKQSTLFVKKLLAIAISNITYLRAVFPEHAYGDRRLQDLPLKILKDTSTCGGACQLITWVKGCFDAIDKRYLRMAIMGIYTDRNDPEKVIESYTFKISYDENGGIDIFRNKSKISSAHAAIDTKKATTQLLRTIVVLTQNLQSLPNNVYMSMKLLYYDEATPGEYEPPGFTASDTDAYEFDDEPISIKVGDVKTLFHTVKLRIKTNAKQFLDADEEMPVTQTENPIESQIESEELDQEEDMQELARSVHLEAVSDNRLQPRRTGEEQVVPEPMEGDIPELASPYKPASDGQAIASPGSLASQSQQYSFGARCGCGFNEDDGMMILCEQCKHWQHAICYGILNENQAPQRHICELCADPEDPNLQPTDQHLVGMNTIAKEATCLWRRALIVCQENSRIVIPDLARRLGVENNVATGLFARLGKEGFLKTTTKRNQKFGKPVDQEKLSLGIKKYFTKEKIDGTLDAVPSQQEEMDSEVNHQIEQLTTGAENICISENTLPQKAEKNRNSKDSEKIQVKQSPLDEMSVSRPAQPLRKGKKRAKLASAEEHDFEISDSQDASQEGKESRKRRRKASNTKTNIQI